MYLHVHYVFISIYVYMHDFLADFLFSVQLISMHIFSAIYTK